MNKEQTFLEWKSFAEARAKQTLPDHWVEDGTQEAYIGLQKAIDSFNPDAGFKFSTYATHCIRNAIYDFVRREKRQTDNLVYTDKIDSILPSVDADAQQMLEQYEMNIAIREACGRLTEREQYVLDNMLSENPESYADIAFKFKTSKMAISRDVARLKKRIKENYNGEGNDS